MADWLIEAARRPTNNGVEPELPDGLFMIDGRPHFSCVVCDAPTPWEGEELGDYEHGIPENVCGGSPRCCP